ncbi:MAG TPA: TIGR03790 family protein [Planctomycetota bacterium]|nr:TIGR03790 family protein [Planctomycetota bacterium]
MVPRLVLLAVFALALQDPEPAEKRFDPAKEVVVLVNENVPESVSIGEYYATRRGIPKQNLCRIRTTPNEICEWSELRKDILEPLKKFLEDKPDVLYIVPTWGVPVKTREENPSNDGRGKQGDTVALMVEGRDFCCIDREIELLKTPHDIDGWFASKVFRVGRKLTRDDGIYIVSRLDGPSAAEARALVDLALYGEAYGIEGRALVDTRGLAGEEGLAGVDTQMREIPPLFQEAGVEFDHDDKSDVIDLATRPTQGHYWGWYTGNIVCSKGDWRFRPGAVGAHLHSFSATQLRRTNQTWTGPLVHHGITGTCGTVYEPLVAGFPYGSVFFERFLDGCTFGESMTIATMFTSWMAVYVGDPLYAPYAPGMKERQQKNRETARNAFKTITAALDAGDTAKALAIAREVDSIGVPYAGADDTSFVVREAKSRAAFLERKARGTVAELRQAIAAAAAATDPKLGASLARKAVDISPASADAALVLARWAVESGAGRDALDAAETAEKGAPGFEPTYWKGRALLLLRKPKEALAAFDDALALKFDPGAMRGAAEALIDLKRYKEAIARLDAYVKRNPEERETAFVMGQALIGVRDWRLAVGVLDGALRDLPVVWSDLKPWAACAELMASALRSEGIEKERPAELLQAVKEIQSGKVRPTPAATAAKIAAAVEDAWTGDKLNDFPMYDERSSGLPRVRIGNRSPGELTVHLTGPVGHTVSLKPFAGKDLKPTELDLPPGVYRVGVLIAEKGKTPKKLFREVRLFPGMIMAIAFDGTHQVYKP